MKKYCLLLSTVFAVVVTQAQFLPNLGPYPKTSKTSICNATAAIKNFSAQYVKVSNGVFNLEGSFKAEKQTVLEVNVQFGRSMRRSMCIKDTATKKKDTTYSNPEYFIVGAKATGNISPSLTINGTQYPGTKEPQRSVFLFKNNALNLSASTNKFSIPINIPAVANPKCREEFETYVTVEVKFSDGCVLSQLVVCKGTR
jgi:hypothetical protein